MVWQISLVSSTDCGSSRATSSRPSWLTSFSDSLAEISHLSLQGGGAEGVQAVIHLQPPAESLDRPNCLPEQFRTLGALFTAMLQTQAPTTQRCKEPVVAPSVVICKAKKAKASLFDGKAPNVARPSFLAHISPDHLARVLRTHVFVRETQEVLVSIG